MQLLLMCIQLMFNSLYHRSISLEKQEKIMRFIDNARIVRGTYDTKATLMGSGNSFRLKAEVDVDGRELTRRYLEAVPLDSLLVVSFYFHCSCTL